MGNFLEQEGSAHKMLSFLHANDLTTRFRERGYHPNIINEGFKRAASIKHEELPNLIDNNMNVR